MIGFDEQSARAMLYALLVSKGEIAGFLADTEEVTHADGRIGYRPMVKRHGRVYWHRRATIDAAPDTEDAKLAWKFAIDVARSHAVDLIVASAKIDPEWTETLCRYRREPTDPRLNPITRAPEKVGPTTDGGETGARKP